MVRRMNLNHTVRMELYATNEIFLENHQNCREALFQTFHELRGWNPAPSVHVWLAAVNKIENYFVFNKSEREMFYIVAEHYYSNIECELEDYPLDTSPNFHCHCERFVGWFDVYLNRTEQVIASSCKCHNFSKLKSGR